MGDDHHDCDCASTGRRSFMRGCGAALAFALAGTSLETVAAEQHSPGAIEDLLEDAPSDWGRWGEDDELGRLNLLGSEEAFEGMNAATKRGKKGIEQFTLQLSMTGEVIDGETGILVRPNDHWGLVDAIGRLADNPERCMRMGERGYRHVVRRYRADQLRESLLKVWGEMVDDGER
jgi:hypothetical protein